QARAAAPEAGLEQRLHAPGALHERVHFLELARRQRPPARRRGRVGGESREEGARLADGEPGRNRQPDELDAAEDLRAVAPLPGTPRRRRQQAGSLVIAQRRGPQAAGTRQLPDRQLALHVACPPPLDLKRTLTRRVGRGDLIEGDPPCAPTPPPRHASPPAACCCSRAPRPRTRGRTP